MRCFRLLALGLLIAPLCVRNAAAEEPLVNELRSGDRAPISSGKEAQDTLSALSTAVRVPPRRHASKSVTETGRPAPIVRMAKPSPYAPVTANGGAASLDELATRLVSHSEPGSAPVEIPSEEAPEVSRTAIRPATVWTPTAVGDIEEEPSAPRVAPVVVANEMPALQPAQPTSSQTPPVMVIAEPAVRAELPTTVTVKPIAVTEKRVSSRAGGGFSNNPLRQGSNSTIISSDLDNPLR
jgi:hypothetical protein